MRALHLGCLPRPLGQPAQQKSPGVAAQLGELQPPQVPDPIDQPAVPNGCSRLVHTSMSSERRARPLLLLDRVPVLARRSSAAEIDRNSPTDYHFYDYSAAVDGARPVASASRCRRPNLRFAQRSARQMHAARTQGARRGGGDRWRGRVCAAKRSECSHRGPCARLP